MRLEITIFSGHVPNRVVIRKEFLYEKDINMVYDVKSYCIVEDSNGLFTIHVVLGNKLVELKHVTSYRWNGQDPVLSPLYDKFYLHHLEAIYLAKEWGLYYFDEPFRSPSPTQYRHLSDRDWNLLIRKCREDYLASSEDSGPRNAQTINEVCRALLEEIEPPNIDITFNYLEDHLNHLKGQL